MTGDLIDLFSLFYYFNIPGPGRDHTRYMHMCLLAITGERSEQKGFFFIDIFIITCFFKFKFTSKYITSFKFVFISTDNSSLLKKESVIHVSYCHRSIVVSFHNLLLKRK